MKHVAKTCPNCGAPLTPQKNSSTCLCEYCGSEVMTVEFAYSIETVNELDKPVSTGADFIVEGTVLVKYIGDEGAVFVPEGISEIAPLAFQDANLDEVHLPSSLRKIGCSAFEDCQFLKSIDIPEGVTSIGSEAFSDCSFLETVRLPSTLEELGEAAFENCSILERIVIPDSVTSIGSRAFEWCSGLTSVTLPASITFLEDIDDVFFGCDSLKRVNSCIDLESYEDYELESAFGDSPLLQSIRRRFHRCIWCGDAAEPGSETCELCS